MLLNIVAALCVLPLALGVRIAEVGQRVRLARKAHLDGLQTQRQERQAAANCASARVAPDLSLSGAEANSSWWVDIRPASEVIDRPSSPKVALLMHADDRLANEDVWLKWLNDAARDGVAYRLIISASNVSSSREFRPAIFRPLVHAKMAETDWCKLLPATIALMKEALRDAKVSHLLLLSHNSIPLKSLKFINEQLEKEPATRMCVDEDWSWGRAETWWLMRRSDAELFTKYEAEHKQHFWRGCIDEESFYYPLKLRMMRWGDLARIINECVMFTDWRRGLHACKRWGDHAALCNCPALDHEPHIDSTKAHPAEFVCLHKESYEQMQKSPFWFARKVTRMC